MWRWTQNYGLFLFLTLTGCGWLVPDFGVSPPDLAALGDLGDGGDPGLSDLQETLDAPPDFVIPPQETWTGDLPVLPPWNCPVALETLQAPVHVGSFALAAPPSATNLLSVYYSQCGETQSLPGPETPFIIQPTAPSRLELRLDCPAPCRAYLFREGCYYQNFQGCWNQDTASWPSPILTPGTFVLAVEQPLPEGALAPPAFSVQVALTPLEPPPACPADHSLRWSELPPLAAEGWVGTTLSLCLPPDGPDRLQTACAASRDTFGGMPELLLEILPDLSGPSTVWLELAVSPKTPDFSFYASLGAADCSAEDFGCSALAAGQSGPSRYSALAFAGTPLRLRLEGDSREVFPLRARCFEVEVAFGPGH